MKKYIWVTSSFVALHEWENCPHESVSYLKNTHRHVFHVKACFEVDGSDREREFFLEKDKLNYALLNYDNQYIGSKSCEMICEELGELLDNPYSVEVSEDGENGSIIIFGE